MSVLLVTSNRLGDAVLTTGTVPFLADRYPGSPITVACGVLPAPLFETMPAVSAVWPLEKKPFGRHWWDLWLLAVGRRWKHVVDLRGSAFSYSVWAKRRTVLHTDHLLRHRIIHLTEVLDAAERVAPSISWCLEHAEEATQRLGEKPGPLLAIGPTANWAGKQWPAARYGELAVKLTAEGGPLSGARILVAGAPSEAGMAEPLLSALPAEKVVTAFGWPLPVLAAAFARASLYIGNDSGLMHLAAAVGVPTIGLFGPSRDEHYAPWGPGNRAVRSPAPYEAYVTADGFDVSLGQRLMGEITVDSVYSAAIETLQAAAIGGRD